MEKTELKKYEMFCETLKAMNRFKPEWQNKQHIEDATSELEAKLGELDEEIALQKRLKLRASDLKKVFKEKTIRFAMLVVSQLKGYADFTNNKELLDELHYTKSAFIISGVKEVVFDAGLIHKLGTAHLAEASDFGLSQAFLDNLLLNTTGLADNIYRPRDQRKLLKECTARLKNLLKEIDDLLKDRLDNYMEIFEDSETEIYIMYHLSRKPVDPMTIKLALRCKIQDAQTKEPIAKATVEIKNHLKRKSSPKGQIMLRNLPEGKYNLMVSIPGYVAQTVKITRVKNVTGVVNVELVKNQ